MSQGVAVELSGGIGNQLFGFAAGLEQAKRLQCELFLDLSQFGESNPRQSIANFFVQPGVSILNGPSKSRKSRLPKLPSRWRDFREAGFEYDPRINEITEGTKLKGYFQSPKYFPNVDTEVMRIFAGRGLGGIELEPTGVPISKRVSLHVRRGDYLLGEASEFHGLTSREYFQNAVALLRKLMPVEQIVLFSDSLELAERELIGLDPVMVRAALPPGSSDLDALAKMSDASGVVMSNSTFSWWAAYAVSKLRGGQVVAPRPWFRDGRSASDLLLPSWVTLGV